MNAMTESARAELSHAVEQLVKPLRVSQSRKCRMREELLAHLETVYGEELERTGNEREAIAGAKNRFGDLAVLSQELRKSIPWWEPALRMVDFLRWNAGESIGHFAGKHLLISPIWGGLRLLNLLIKRWFSGGRAPNEWFSLWIVLATGVGIAMLLIGWIMTMTEFSRNLFGNKSQRSALGAFCIGILALLVFPSLSVALFGGILPEFGISMRYARTVACCIAAPITLLHFFCIAKQVIGETRDLAMRTPAVIAE